MANSVCEETDRTCKQKAKQIYCKYDLTENYYAITEYIYLDITPQKNSGSTDNTTNIKNKEQVIKSNDTTLDNIEISKGKLEFKKSVYEYNLEVENEVETFSISATPNDEKAIITGTGEYKLNVGVNEIKLVVTAEDESTTEYTINVMIKEKLEITTDVEPKKENRTNNYKTTIISFVCGIVILVTVVMIVRKKCNKR